MPRLSYKCDWKKIKEKALSSHQKDYKIGSVMEAVKKAVSSGMMEDPYLKYESMKEDGITEVKLHASRGSALQADGGNVLEFDLAGSGFTHFRAVHEKISGEDEYVKNGVKVPFKDIRTKSKWKIHWWNRIKWPDFIKNLLGIHTVEDIITQHEVVEDFNKSSGKSAAKREVKSASTQNEAQNLRNQQMVNQQMMNPQVSNQQMMPSQGANQQMMPPQGANQQIMPSQGANPQMMSAQVTNQQMMPPQAGNLQNMNSQPETQKSADPNLDELLIKRYGVNPNVKGLEGKKHIYVKSSNIKGADGLPVNRTRYTIAGTQTSILGFYKGARNRGEYSIKNVSEYMLTAGIDYLQPFFDKWNREGIDPPKGNVKPVTVMIKGHSRGGVAAAHGAMRIKNWISENYPQYDDMVKFEITQLDPVAGLGSDHGVKSELNLVEESRESLKNELDERGMKTLGTNAETTLVYSLHTDHPIGFAPQIVDGAKRIILTATNHAVNLDTVDESQKQFGDKKSHREGYMDLSTGEMYRNSGLNELPEGIYIADENKRLIKIPNSEVGKAIIGEVLKNTTGQKSRHRRIENVMDNWFKAREIKKTAVKEKIAFSKESSLANDNKKQQMKLSKTRTVAPDEKKNQNIIKPEIKRSNSRR